MGSNWRRTGSPQDDEPDSAVCGDEPAHLRRSPKHVRYAGLWRVKRYRGTQRGWGRNAGKVWRDKRGDLQPEVTEPDDPRLVWVFQTCRTTHIQATRSIYSKATEGASAQAGKAPRNGAMPRRSQAMAKCILRKPGTVHHGSSPPSEPIPMRKPPTGEPCAGKPHARFGGRGGLKSFPTPIGGTAGDDEGGRG